MREADIIKALDVGAKWTRQVKAEEKRPSARQYRSSMWKVSRKSLKEICYDHMEEAWNKASSNGRLPTHWRQVFYVMRPICDDHPESDRPLRDTTFKQIIEAYLADYSPGWDVLRGARGVFKEPHSAESDSGVPMSTMGIRNYLSASEPGSGLEYIKTRFPTKGARNRFGAVLICEKEGFDELLQAEHIPERYDIALMSTKGISALAARHLADSVGVPCFTLHDLDKNGFVMAGGFEGATDIGIRIEDVGEWGLASEDQHHSNPAQVGRVVLRHGGSPADAEFISSGQRVELNALTSPQFIEFVESKLKANGVEKVIPDDDVLAAAWRRAVLANRINAQIEKANDDPDTIPVPDDLPEQIGRKFEEDDKRSWDSILAGLIPDEDDELNGFDDEDE